MASQVAIHKDLKDRFVILDYKSGRGVPTYGTLGSTPSEAFEEGKLLVFDNLNFHDLSYFFEQPGKWYPDWVPPLFSQSIQRSIEPDHVLREYYQDDHQIRDFQRHAQNFELAWLKVQQEIFPHYKWELNEFSYRFNHMSLGFLHLDVPDKTYEEHQFRWFINLDKKPRILTIGPTIFELAHSLWNQMNLKELSHLPPHSYIGEIRKRILDDTVYRERELPRHYLTLDPGSLWLAHSSYISHGLVYGQKTACLEGHIKPSTLRNPHRHFNSLLREMQKTGPQTEKQLEQSLEKKKGVHHPIKPLNRLRSLLSSKGRI